MIPPPVVPDQDDTGCLGSLDQCGHIFQQCFDAIGIKVYRSGRAGIAPQVRGPDTIPRVRHGCDLMAPGNSRLRESVQTQQQSIAGSGDGDSKRQVVSRDLLKSIQVFTG